MVDFVDREAPRFRWPRSRLEERGQRNDGVPPYTSPLGWAVPDVELKNSQSRLGCCRRLRRRTEKIENVPFLPRADEKDPFSTQPENFRDYGILRR